jgi:hypothetical protein
MRPEEGGPKSAGGFQDHRHSPSFRLDIASIRAVPRSSARSVAQVSPDVSPSPSTPQSPAAQLALSPHQSISRRAHVTDRIRRYSSRRNPVSGFFRELSHAKAPPSEKPFRDELLSIERLEERALALAASFTIDPSPWRRARNIFPRFDDNARVLRDAYRTLADDVRTGQVVTAAAEWLLDNFHLVTSEIRNIHQHLPGTYYRQLPTLASREQAGHPRIYAMTVELVRHSDSRLDRHQLGVLQRDRDARQHAASPVPHRAGEVESRDVGAQACLHRQQEDEWSNKDAKGSAWHGVGL